jgi:hypothetical protein
VPPQILSNQLQSNGLSTEQCTSIYEFEINRDIAASLFFAGPRYRPGSSFERPTTQPPALPGDT